MASDIQTDEQGRRFLPVRGTNRRSYISPVAFGGQRPEGDGGMFKEEWQWDQNKGKWHQPADLTTIGLMGVGGLAGAAALPALLGGAPASAAPAAGGLSEAAIPTAIGTTGIPAATAAGGSTVAGGMSFGKLAGLGALGTGFDLLGSLLGGGDGQGRKSFAGRRAANGQDIDPGNVYGEGMAGMRQLMPIMQERVTNPKPRLRDVYAQPVAGLSGVDPAYQRRQAGGGGNGMTPEQLAIIRQVLGI